MYYSGVDESSPGGLPPIIPRRTSRVRTFWDEGQFSFETFAASTSPSVPNAPKSRHRRALTQVDTLLEEFVRGTTRATTTTPSRADARLREQELLLGVQLIVTLVTAWSSVTFFHPDEHFQILEFLGLKLGFTEARELPWEFAAQIRPWLQPALYYVIAKPLLALGLTDRFTLAFVLRALSGLLAFAALRSLVRTSAPWLQDVGTRRSSLQFLTLAGFLPYLAVRTSSENLTASFFLLGFSVLMRERAPEATGSTTPTEQRDALVAGVLFGLAFECRFQSAILIAGMLAWLVVISRARVRVVAAMLLGALLPVVAAAFIDHWGYGVWSFPPADYLRVNLFEGMAAQYGTKPFHGYLHITLPNIMAPVVFLLNLGLLVCWLRRPRHVITWLTLPFIAVHSVLAHKEERFLFPIAQLSLLAAALALEPRDTPIDGHYARFVERLSAGLRWLKTTRAFRVVIGLNFVAMLLLALYPLGWRPHEVFYEWVYRTMPGPVHFGAAAEDVPEVVPQYPFFRARRWQVDVEPAALANMTTVGSRAQGLASTPASAPRADYWLRREPFTAPEPDSPAAGGELIFSEFPGWQSPWLRRHLWPTLGAVRIWAIAHGSRHDRWTWISVYRTRNAARLASAVEARPPHNLREDPAAGHPSH